MAVRVSAETVVERLNLCALGLRRRLNRPILDMGRRAIRRQKARQWLSRFSRCLAATAPFAIDSLAICIGTAWTLTASFDRSTAQSSA